MARATALTDRSRRHNPRNRLRSATATPTAVLRILLDGHPVHVPTMMSACWCSRNVVHQAISRLRKDGFRIETIPKPGGSLPSDFYQLLPGQEVRAGHYLTETYVRSLQTDDH